MTTGSLHLLLRHDRPIGKQRGSARSRQAFTLVELLAVIAVILVLLGLIIPSMNYIHAGALTSGGNQLADLMHQARLNSLAKGNLTAVAIVDDSDLGERHHRRAVILMEKGPPDNVWRPLGKWEHLPDTVVAVDPDSDSTSFFAQTPAIPLDKLPRLGTSNVSPTSCKYQVFLPSGRLSTRDIASPTAPVVRLVTLKEQNNETPDNYYELKLNLYTGVPLIRRP